MSATMSPKSASPASAEESSGESQEDLHERLEKHLVMLKAQIAQRKEVEEALRHSQALLIDAERLAHLGSWDWDIARDAVTWSDELYRIYGFEPGEFDVTFDGFLSHVYPEDRQRVALIIQQAYASKEPFRFFHRIIRPDGEVRTLFAQGKPVLNDNGEIERMYGTGQDVSEQKEAEARLMRQAQQLDALNKMGQTVAATLDLTTVFDNVLGELQILLRAEGILILMLEGDELVLVAANKPKDNSLIGWRVPAASGVAGDALLTGEAIGLFGSEAGERVYPSIVKTTGFRPEALMVAPLRLRGESIGVMEAVHSEPDGFDHDDLRLLEAAAAWTAIAVGNARLFEAQQQGRRAAETLRDANVELTQSLELKSVLDTLLDYVDRLIGCDVSSVKLLEGSQLRIAAIRGRELVQERYSLLDLAADQPLKLIVDRKKSLLVSDSRAFDNWDVRLGDPELIKSWLGVPLVAAGRIIGIYTAGKRHPNYFSERHLLLAEALAGQAAIAVQNARLFSQVRFGRERLRYLTRQVVSTQEEERRRVSRELHDEAGQALTALKMSLKMIGASLPDEMVETRDQLAEAATLTDSTMEQIRLLAHDLRPPVLDTFGLNTTLEGYCGDFAKRSELAITYEGCDLPPLRDEVTISFYRFLQEALTNTVKHAGASQVQVSLRHVADTVYLAIRDNGRGFKAEQVLTLTDQSSGLGLVGMQERFELLGGQIEIDTAPGKGTEITASVPHFKQKDGG